MDQLPREELARIQKILEKNMLAISSSLQPYFKLLEKQLPFIQSAMASFAQAMSQIIAPLQKLQQPLLQFAESRRKQIRIVKAFQECNLWLAPSMMELSDKITQLYYEGKKHVIPSIISRYYKNNNWDILKKTVHNWDHNRFFHPRMGIIYDALEAHIDGKYTLSVPALLPHIEGITLDIIKKYDLPKLDEPIIYRKDTYGTDGAVTSPSRVFAQAAINAFSFEEFVAIESFLYYLERTLYFSPHGIRKGLKRLKRESQLKRHAILHGIQIKYATLMNSLRCFLALDVISLINDNDK